jgi:hypothetical protein
MERHEPNLARRGAGSERHNGVCANSLGFRIEFGGTQLEHLIAYRGRHRASGSGECWRRSDLARCLLLRPYPGGASRMVVTLPRKSVAGREVRRDYNFRALVPRWQKCQP